MPRVAKISDITEPRDRCLEFGMNGSPLRTYPRGKHVLLRKDGVMTVSIRLTPEEEQRLEKLSRRTGRSESFYIRAALREHLTDVEDAFAADEELNAFEAAGSRSRRLAALKAESEL